MPVVFPDPADVADVASLERLALMWSALPVGSWPVPGDDLPRGTMQLTLLDDDGAPVVTTPALEW